MVWSAPDFILTYSQSLVTRWYGVPLISCYLLPEFSLSMVQHALTFSEQLIQLINLLNVFLYNYKSSKVPTFANKLYMILYISVPPVPLGIVKYVRNYGTAIQSVVD